MNIDGLIRHRAKELLARQQAESSHGRFITDILLDKDLNLVESPEEVAYLMTVDLRTHGMGRSKIAED